MDGQGTPHCMAESFLQAAKSILHVGTALFFLLLCSFSVCLLS